MSAATTTTTAASGRQPQPPSSKSVDDSRVGAGSGCERPHPLPSPSPSPPPARSFLRGYRRRLNYAYRWTGDDPLSAEEEEAAPARRTDGRPTIQAGGGQIPAGHDGRIVRTLPVNHYANAARRRYGPVRAGAGVRAREGRRTGTGHVSNGGGDRGRRATGVGGRAGGGEGRGEGQR